MSHKLIGYHGIGIAPNFPTITPGSSLGAKIRDIRWAPNAVGYLPPGVRNNVAILQPSVATYVMLPDRLFKQAAFETIDASILEPRWLTSMDDPISLDLVNAMIKLADSIDMHDFPVLAESIGIALAVRMLVHLGAKSKLANTPYPGGLPKDKLKLVVDYVEANISRQIRLPELAGIVHISVYHFARAFKQAMNIAPIRYVWQQRVERAKRLLRSTKVPLVAIAYDCGFSSQSHFTTAFKEATGVTPSAFRLAS